jgi:hypothetical protein
MAQQRVDLNTTRTQTKKEKVQSTSRWLFQRLQARNRPSHAAQKQQHQQPRIQAREK